MYWDPTGHLTEIADKAIKLFTDIINNPNSTQLQIDSAKQNIQNVLDNDAAGRLSNPTKASDLPRKVIRDVAKANNVDMSVAESMVENDIFWEQNQYHTVDAIYPMARKGTGDVSGSAIGYNYPGVLLASTSNTNLSNFLDPIKNAWKGIKDWWNNSPTFEEMLRESYGVGNNNAFAQGAYEILPSSIQIKVDNWVNKNKDLAKTNPELYETKYADLVLNFVDTYENYQQMFDGIERAFSSDNTLVVLAAAILYGGGTTGNKTPKNGKLFYISGGWESTQGLIYEKTGFSGNRVKHVLEHGTPDPMDPNHSVFNVSKKEILSLVDEAWSVRGNIKPVQQSNGNEYYDIDIGNKAIGTNGETKIRIVVEQGMRVIVTAHPTN